MASGLTSDIIVVGGSIAGAATAVHLARLGHRVRLLERARLPRRKACGEGLFAKGVEELDALGLLAGLMPRASVLRLLRMELAGCSVEAPLRSAIGIRREVLDAALLELAASSGVDVCCGVNVTALIESEAGFEGVRTDHGDFGARVIVAADGLRSRLRRQAGLDDSASKDLRYGVSAHFELPRAPAPRVEISFEDGYEVYVTPVGGRCVNVALLLSTRAARGLAGRLEEQYCALVEGSVALLAGAQLVEAPVASGPFAAKSRRSWRANLALAGDAAGFYDGISGEGMSLALAGARSCAVAIHAYLLDGDTRHFEMYDRQLRRQARNSTLLARLNIALASRPVIGRRVLQNLSRHPETFAKLVAINQGVMDFRSLRPRDVTALLFGI